MFKDKRFGEYNAKISPEEKMIRRFTLERQVKYRNLKKKKDKHLHFQVRSVPINRGFWMSMLFYVWNFYEKAIFCGNPKFLMKTFRFCKTTFWIARKPILSRFIDWLVFFWLLWPVWFGNWIRKRQPPSSTLDGIPVQLWNSHQFICWPEQLSNLLSFCSVNCMYSTVLSASSYSVSRTE